MNREHLYYKICIIPLIALIAIISGNLSAHSPVLITLFCFGAFAFSIIISRGLKAKELNNSERFFYIGFAITLILSWSPFKSLAYLAPFFFITLFALLNIFDRKNNTISKLFILLIFWTSLSGLYYLINRSFSIQNSIICFFTYGSLLPLLLISNSLINNKQLLIKMCRCMIPVLWVESILGIVQGLYGVAINGGLRANFGDFVEGTIHPQLYAESTLSNPMFSLNIAFGILGLLYLRMEFKKNIYNDILLFFCFLAFCLASVVHLIALFLLSLFAATLVISFTKRLRFNPILIVILFSIASMLFLALNKNSINNVSSRINAIKYGESYKSKVYIDFYHKSKTEPHLPITGSGPGQYGSRAALISAGYLGSLPIGIKYTSAAYFDELLYPYWVNWLSTWSSSATNSPGSSTFALLSEFGLLSVILLLLLLFSIVRKYCRLTANNAGSIIFLSGVFFIVSIGLIDLYWEIPQAIFIGCLFLKALYAQTITQASTLENKGSY